MSVPRYDTGKVKEDTYESLILIKAGNNIHGKIDKNDNTTKKNTPK